MSSLLKKCPHFASGMNILVVNILQVREHNHTHTNTHTQCFELQLHFMAKKVGVLGDQLISIITPAPCTFMVK